MTSSKSRSAPCRAASISPVLSPSSPVLPREGAMWPLKDETGDPTDPERSNLVGGRSGPEAARMSSKSLREVDAGARTAGTRRALTVPSAQDSKRKSVLRLGSLSSIFPSLIAAQPIGQSGQEARLKPAGSSSSPAVDRTSGTQPPSRQRPESSPKAKTYQGLGLLSPTTSLPDTALSHPASDSPSPGNYEAGLAREKLRKPSPTPQPTQPSAPPENASTPPPDSKFSAREMKSSPKLTKQPAPRPRSNSFHNDGKKLSVQQARGGRRPSPSPDGRGRSTSAQFPSNWLGGGTPLQQPTPAAATASSRPASSNSNRSPPRETERRGRLRRSWLPGSRSRANSQELSRGGQSKAWILGQNDTDYNTSFLASGDRVPELWNENGNLYVFLVPKGSGGGPSFKLMDFVVADSMVLADMIEDDSSSLTDRSGRDSLSVADAERRPRSPGGQLSGDPRLYIPISMSFPNQTGKEGQDDLERAVSVRNLFAFLVGQPLVATKAQPTFFSIFMRISGLLKEYGFSNPNCSTFGDATEISFGCLMDQAALADVRHSREKTLEALVLGERMRSQSLYSQAFVHAVGKYPTIRDLDSPLWEKLSPNTRQRLERAYLDLQTRQNNVNNRLVAFEFPALFSGVANSTSLSEYKSVRFQTWRKSFNRMRQFVLGFYKSRLGSWPPKARSKKNPFSESGLNRQVLKILYSDLCALYDLLVDRQSVTPRVMDQAAEDIVDDVQKPHVSALRKVLTEFDHSSPPVLPPIPFDIPKIPDMTSLRENYYELSPKEQARLDRNLQEYQTLLVLNKAYDFDTMKLKVPFLKEFKDFELKEAKGRSVAEMAHQRIGYWLFLYVVIQSLPMLVVDAPGLQFTEGVEYFLCEPLQGQFPWMEDAPELRKRWYELAGGGFVELSTDTVEFSVEGIYRRSHCWLAAKHWEMAEKGPAAQLPQEGLSPLQAPQSVFADMDPMSPRSRPSSRNQSPSRASPGPGMRTRGMSPAKRNSWRSSVVGLEPVPLPADDGTGGRQSPRSVSATVPGQRPSSVLVGRSRSQGNLRSSMMSAPPDEPLPDKRHAPGQGSLGGSTFDDILKDVETEAKPKKKKTTFFS